MKRKKLWLSLLLVVALLAAWFEPTRCVRGVLASEPFHQGRPASYWAAEWEHWCVTHGWHGNVLVFSPDPAELADNPADNLGFGQLAPVPLWDRISDLYQRAVLKRKTPPGRAKIVETAERVTPPLLAGDDPAALPVLESLENHVSPKVRVFARYGIEKIRAAKEPLP